MLLSKTVYPATLKAGVYANDPAPRFLEQTVDRYNPEKTPIGVAFSGGGPRAFCCAHGQMASYAEALNGSLLASTGAISCVSGGSWFGGLYSYADPSISDERLFGTVTKTAPRDLTPGLLAAQIDSECLISTIPNLTNTAIATYLGVLWIDHKYFGLPLDRLWSRLVNLCFCANFGVGATNQSYTLDGKIGAAGTSLPDIATYKQRPDRPFFIANATQLWPLGADIFMRRFEFSALYSGMPQEFKGQGAGGSDLGYGYAQSFAFNSAAPSAPPAGGVVTVQTPDPLAILSDALGSSSAAFGELVAKWLPDPSKYIDPAYDYWPLTKIGSEPTQNYQIVDGGALENTGIVGLLARGFPIIFAFVNSSYPLGSTSDGCVDGVDGQVSRLFGLNPKETLGNNQDTRVFDDPSVFTDVLAPALKAAKKDGPPVYTSRLEIWPGNKLGVNAAAYPDGVYVVWVYNDLDPVWMKALPSPVRDLFSAQDPCNRLDNFPNLKTVDQNTCDHIPELLWYSPTQANLLANMWYFAMLGDHGQAAFEGVKARLGELGY
jgi:hypothetical protein